MQFFLHINQVKALEWGLNSQQAMLFSWLYHVPSWADAAVLNEQVFYNVAKTKIIEELPLLTDKPDTAYRLLKQLQDFGIVEITSSSNKTYFRMTEKAKEWNFKGSEKYPTLPDQGRKNIRSRVGKKSEPGSEKNPTNHNTNNQVTNNHNSLGSTDAEPSKKSSIESEFENLWAVYPEREGSNPRNKALSAYRASRKRGHELEAIRAGLIRYNDFCRGKGNLNTPYVMQASRFFGPGDEFLNEWTVQSHESSRTAAARPSLAERQEAQTRAALALIGSHDADYGSLDPNGSALPQQVGIPGGTADDDAGWSGTTVHGQCQAVG